MDILGLKSGENCLVFDTTEKAVEMAKRWSGVDEDGYAARIAAAGAKLARDNHTWSVRVLELQKYIDAVREASGHSHERKGEMS